MNPIRDVEWQDDAACRNSGLDFFQEQPDWECYLLCDTCPVSTQCLKQAMEIEHYGFWAGTREEERFAMRRAQGIAQPFFDRTMNRQVSREAQKVKTKLSVPIPHGEERGYQLHMKRLTLACEECKAAHREYIADYRRKKSEQQSKKKQVV